MTLTELEQLNRARAENAALKSANESLRIANHHLFAANHEHHRTIADLRERLQEGRFDKKGDVPEGGTPQFAIIGSADSLN